MKKRYSFYLLVMFAGLLVYCGTTKVLTTPGTAEFDAAKKRWTDISQTDLTEGFTIFTTKCKKCHGLKDIPSRTEEKWTDAIKRMAPKAKLSEIETTKLTQYIFTTRELGVTKTN